VLRSHLRAILPATVAALFLGGCMPSSSGPSIPSIPRSSDPDAPNSDQAGTAVPSAAVKKHATRRTTKTQAAPRARPPEVE